MLIYLSRQKNLGNLAVVTGNLFAQCVNLSRCQNWIVSNIFIVVLFAARCCTSDLTENLISCLTIRDAQELQRVSELQSPLQFTV